MQWPFFLLSCSLTPPKALRPSGGEAEPCPKKLPEILLLSNDPRPDAPYMLANSLWFHYHKSANWAWSIWDNTFAALRVQANAEASRDTRYATFLLHVDQHLPGGLDEHVARWFQETGKAELTSIDGVAWTSLTHTLLHLVVQGVLATTTIMKGLVYPLWSHALASGTADCEVYLRAAHDIFTRLVLSGEDWGSDMVELQRVRARRQDVFCAPHLSLLVGAIPTLVFLEHAQHVPADLRPRAAELRDAVCGSVEFRQGIYRDLNAVRDAFDKSLQYDALDESLVEPLMDALRLILNVARTGTALCSCFHQGPNLTECDRYGEYRVLGVVGHVRFAKPLEVGGNDDRSAVFPEANGRTPGPGHAE